MKYGFTTGSCAAAASKAAAYMLLSGREQNNISIETPGGKKYDAVIEDIKRDATSVSCAVRKDGGDDPDITSGLLIYSRVSFSDRKDGAVHIEAGEGVGRVTKPGLDRPVGDAAINTVPRKMITDEVNSVREMFGHEGSLLVIISVPGGAEVAKKTFNPKLGIEGGISIIGTSGIVEPMSSKALLDTIRVELNQRKALGYDYVAISPGNYGRDFLSGYYGYDIDKSVKCSNYIGDTADMASELGFEEVLLVGHIGKLIKVSGGIMNTHSREADCRMEILVSLALKHGVPSEDLLKITECVSTEEAAGIIERSGKLSDVMNDAVSRICLNLQKRVMDKVRFECIIFSKDLGELAVSEGAGKLIDKLKEEAL